MPKLVDIKYNPIFALITVVFLVIGANVAVAKELTILMQSTAAVKNKNIEIGIVQAYDTAYGLLLEADLHSLPPGPSITEHSLRIYPNADCGEYGNKAGLLPLGADEDSIHFGPYDAQSAQGILPNILSDAGGISKVQILAPQLKINDIINKSLVIHSKADKFAEEGYISGDLSARIACGVIIDEKQINE